MIKLIISTYGKYFLVLAALAASLVVGLVLPGMMDHQNRIFLLAGGILAILPAVFLFKNPEILLLSFVPAALILPFSIGTGTESSINVAMILVIVMLAFWIAEKVILKKQMGLQPSRLLLSIFSFMGLCLFGFLFGQIRWYPIDPAPMRSQIGGLVLYILSTLTLILGAYRLNTINLLKWIVYPFLVIGLIFILYTAAASIGLSIFSIPTGSLGCIFWIWISTFSFSFALFHTSLAIHWRIGSGLIFVLATVYSISPQNIGWTSGWLPSFVGIFITLLIARPKWSLLIAPLMILFLAFNFNAIQSVFLAGDNAYSISTREYAWQILTQIVRADPIFGLGFANYYWYTPYFPILGYFVSFNSHSNYIDIIAQIGIIGMAGFVWMFAELFFVGLRLRRRISSGFSFAYLVGAIGGLAGMTIAGFLGDWVLPFVYNVGFSGFRSSSVGWLFLGGIAMLDRLTPPYTPQVS